MTMKQAIEAVTNKQNYSNRQSNISVEYRNDRNRTDICYKGALISVYFMEKVNAKMMVQVCLPPADSYTSQVLFLNKLMQAFNHPLKFRASSTNVYRTFNNNERVMQSGGLYKYMGIFSFN